MVEDYTHYLQKKIIDIISDESCVIFSIHNYPRALNYDDLIKLLDMQKWSKKQWQSI